MGLFCCKDYSFWLSACSLLNKCCYGRGTLFFNFIFKENVIYDFFNSTDDWRKEDSPPGNIGGLDMHNGAGSAL